ncbi:hypothetical protein L208DRAFT_1231574 [Tricholoma matsutake]|nr:hypothetical protein L208DRAFT_1231574 [Tricholoma matsutake 945]
MTPPPDLGCAVCPNGSLKDASEINWHFDKDDNTPFTVTAKSPESGSSQTLHPFFLGQASPAILVAGSHQSGCAIHPSNHVVDPDNVMNSTSSTQKQKAPVRKSSCHVIQMTVHLSEDSCDDKSDGEDATTSRPMHGESTDVEETEDAVSGQEYMSLRAMAEADHEVSAAFASTIVCINNLVMSR